ncbi:MAG: hypothetical protein WC314_26555 [Vulcanimicrobiota bacterium]
MATAVYEKQMEALSLELEQWRSVRQRPGGRLPERFWSRAAELAREVGPEQVCSKLHLSAAGLTKRLGLCGSTAAVPVRKEPTFVELLVGTPTAGSLTEAPCGNCTIKIEAVSGARMQVDVSNLAPSGLATILREFSR